VSSTGRRKRTAFIALGSNIEPEENLPLAAQALRRLGQARGVSKVYESEAIGPAGQPRFLNAVVGIEVDLDADALRETLREIEAEMGRVRTADPYAPRPIDLDLVALDAFLDPEVGRRAYLAVSLAEVAPDVVLGASGETVADRADHLRATTTLKRRDDVDLSRAVKGAP
jgi:2-amino-4-hydroxy-6-hydroxymethyldihydropteridine diphosphokinase